MASHLRKEYFEGILQLRNPTHELVDFVRGKVEREGKAHIAKQEPVPGGIDLYISSNHYMQNLGQSLQKRFPGQLIVSRRLFSKNKLTSRQVYRVNVMFRLSDLQKGDHVLFKGKEHVIMAFAKKVTIRDAKTGARKTVQYEDLKKMHGTD